MGCNSSSTADPVEKEQAKKDKLVNKELLQSKDHEERIHKLLLLGSGGSGKSTLFKQLQCIHTNGFVTKQRRMFQTQIYEQLIESMKTLITKCEEFYDDEPEKYGEFKLYDYDNDDDKSDEHESVTYLLSLQNGSVLNNKIVGHLRAMWKHDKIQAMYALRHKICVPDSTQYFFDDLDRITAPDYIPSNEDLLLVRYRTTGIQEKSFTIENNQFSISDVGGQRNERKKWIHFFDGVTAVIFVVGLSCYDELTFESEDNAMEEALDVFDQQVNSVTFANMPFILFLNKSDIYFEKIKTVKIKTCPRFENYQGEETDAMESLNFIKEFFAGINRNTQRDIFPHVTNATNKDNVKKVFNDVQTMVISSSLAETGLAY